MKKITFSSMLVALLVMSANAGIITSSITNETPKTTVVSTAGAKVTQIAVASATDNLIYFYDSSTNSLTYVVGAFTYVTNITQNYTNLTTNGIFIYPTATNYLIQTNIYVGANTRSNVSLAGATNQYPVSYAIAAIAGVSTASGLDLNFVRGISVTTTNAATLIITTVP